MTEQTKMEIIKALAYCIPLQQIAEAESIEISVLQQLQQDCADEIDEEREDLQKAGYIK